MGKGLSGQQRLIATFMALDAAAGSRHSASLHEQIYPPAVSGPPGNADWSRVFADPQHLDTLVTNAYDGDQELISSNWIRRRWHNPQEVWRPLLDPMVARLRAFDLSTDRFSDDEIAAALLDVVDERRSGDEAANRERLDRNKVRKRQVRVRPSMRLRELYREWESGNEPRPQTALEYLASVDDFIEFAGDVLLTAIDADILYDFRDEVAKLPASMPRADRKIPFTARVIKHAETFPKVSPATVKKRVGALQALLTYAFQQRWTSNNTGSGIRILNYNKKRRDPRREAVVPAGRRLEPVLEPVSSLGHHSRPRSKHDTRA